MKMGPVAARLSGRALSGWLAIRAIDPPGPADTIKNGKMGMIKMIATTKRSGAIVRCAKNIFCGARALRRLALIAVLTAPLAFVPAMSQASPISPPDPCLSLLSLGFTPGSAADENSKADVGLAPAAGKAATLGLLFGVRHALGPTEDLNGIRLHATAQTAPVTALDIVRYRSCKKAQALRVSYVVK
jgi:hypothetical protein